MAPEMIKGERFYTTKVDIWSFGILAMELADGDPPYINEPQGRVIFNIVKNVERDIQLPSYTAFLICLGSTYFKKETKKKTAR